MFIYSREAHPAERFEAHTSLEQKRAHAQAMAERWGIERRMLVDDLEGTLHRAYGALPNMSWVVDRRGRVVYKANWTDPRTIAFAIDQALWEGERRASGQPLNPYTIEMSVARERDRPAFLAGLLEVGPRAVEEFIEAGRHTWGDGPARPMIEWWEANKPADNPENAT